MMQYSITPQNLQRAKRCAVYVASGLMIFSIGAREIFGHSGYLARRRRHIQIESLSNEIRNLRRENSELVRKIRDLNTDPDTIEKLAREQLRLSRPGDYVVTLTPAQPPVTASSTTPGPQ